ncbi:MAG TPA: hypothetical protein VF746_30840 [Longimicrobium sp.]|jgi:hypothetical protein
MKWDSSPAVRLALCCALVACEGRSGLNPAADSVPQVAVVENASPRWTGAQEWRLSEAPVVRIGLDEPALTGVAGAVRLGDGRIVVADRGGSALRFYGPDGRYLGSYGREGAGPGEFRTLDGLSRLEGDSLLVWDRAAARASIFDPAGTFVRSVRPVGIDALPSLVGVFPDGGFIVTGGIRPTRMTGASGSERRDSVTLLHVGPQGELRDTVGRFAGKEVYLDVSQGALTFESVIFGRSTSFAVGRDRLFAADNASFDIAEIDSSGKLVRRIRRDVEPRPANRVDVQRYREFLRDRDLSGVPAGLRGAAARRAASIPHRATLPALNDMHVDADGNLWVERYRVPGSGPGTWDVLDPDGRWLGAVRTPAGFRITEIRRDYLLGVAAEESDGEQVQLYRLLRGR